MYLRKFHRFNDFGVDGGPAAKELAPKLDLAKAHLSSRLGVTLPDIEVNVVITLLFSICVLLITWGMDFWRWDKSLLLFLHWKEPEAYSLLLETSSVLIFWLGFFLFTHKGFEYCQLYDFKISIGLFQAFYLVVFSPILYDFYNYGPQERHFSLLLTEFLQVCSELYFTYRNFKQLETLCLH